MMHQLRARVKGLLTGSSRGFTTMELVVTLGLLGITMSLLGGAIFQALGIQRYWQDDAMATKELRNAVSWFSQDALNTQASDLVDEAPAVSSVTLTWTDADDVSHAVTYTVVGREFLRNIDGVQHAVARGVASAGFSLSGKVLTFNLVVDASEGDAKSVSQRMYLRRLQ